MIDIRLAVAADMPVLLRLARAFYDEDGFTTTAFILESGLVAELQDLYVTPDARGTGVGTALIEDSARWARSVSATQLEVVIAPNGQDVSHLFSYYAARGFLDDGRRILARDLSGMIDG